MLNTEHLFVYNYFDLTAEVKLLVSISVTIKYSSPFEFLTFL